MLGSSDEQEVPRRRTVRRRTATLREERVVREPRVARRTGARRSAAAARSREEDQTEELAVKEETKEITENRKAPTPLAAEQLIEHEKRKRFIMAVTFMLIGIGASAAVGLTDQGRIDVERTIEERNERIRNNRPDERDIITSVVEVPVQDTSSVGKVDGGLVGRGTGGRAPEPSPIDLASTTASTTDNVASSTEAVASSTEEVVSEEGSGDVQPEVTSQEVSPPSEETTQ